MEQTIKIDNKAIAIISGVLLLLTAIMFCQTYNHITTFNGHSAAVETLQWSSDTCWVKW